VTTERLSAFKLLPLIGFCFLQAATAQAAPSATAARHCLWKVSGDHNAVYLLGSVHVLKAGDYPLAAPIERAFTNAAVAVFETDINQMEQPATQQKMLAKAMVPPNETLEQQFSPEGYSRYTNLAAEVGLPIQMLDRLKPAMGLFTMVLLQCQQLGLEPEHGLDLHFFKLARKEKKIIVPLETVDFQINLVTDFTKSENDQLVKATLDEIKTTKKMLGDMVRAWKTGDAAALEKLLNSARQDAPVIFKRLVTDRNQRWLPKIEELLHGDKNAIVIVGAGHLVGPGGLVDLLKQKGFKVVQE